MASKARLLGRVLFQTYHRIPAKRKCYLPPQSHHAKPIYRTFSSAKTWLAREDSDERRSSDKSDDTPSLASQHPPPITANDLDPESCADYDARSKDEQIEYLQQVNAQLDELYSAENEGELDRLADQIAYQADKEAPVMFVDPKLPVNEIGYWAEDEEDEFAQVEDGDDDSRPTDITSAAEADLELHREMREYARITAWDMPLLSKFAKKFEPPPLTSPLRFRYTTYMGESHPAARKVVLQFCTRDLAHHTLTEPQRIKLLKLVGVRYNPTTDVVRMSCEKFENQAQNKRYLGDLLGKLIQECREGEDMFEDVPVDFRHHKPKRVLVYPEEWKLSRRESVKELGEARQKVRLLEEAGEEAREVVDGSRVVQEYVRLSPAGFGRAAAAVMAASAAGGEPARQQSRPLPAIAQRKNRLAGIR